LFDDFEFDDFEFSSMIRTFHAASAPYAPLETPAHTRPDLQKHEIRQVAWHR
jgi:hypothetical protein